MNSDLNARVIAYYLPQFHPIPENDQWWGKGFTEWTNVAKAKPLFKGHYQPKIPADLGFYDLRLSQIREEQAKLAKEAGIEGFCYWHYWFGKNRTILNLPFKEVLNSGSPDYPFCLGWANHSWTNKTWEAGTRKVKESTLIEQQYNPEDIDIHFQYVLPAFKDKRYITVDGKPLFTIFDPESIPNLGDFVKRWQNLARINGLKGIFFVGNIHTITDKERTLKRLLLKKEGSNLSTRISKLRECGIDAVETVGQLRAEFLNRNFFSIFTHSILKRIFGVIRPITHKMAKINSKLFVEEDKREDVFPTLFPNWDRSPRSGKKAIIFTESTPEVFADQIKKGLEVIKNKPKERKILFVRSWNEWGEGNYLEPDLKYGHGYLNALRSMIKKT